MKASSKDSSKPTGGTINQLDDMLDSFFQANKFKGAKKPVLMHTNSNTQERSKMTLSNKSEATSSQAQCSQGISNQPNYLSSYRDPRIPERNSYAQTQNAATNFFDSSSDEENIIEQFKPYSAAHRNLNQQIHLQVNGNQLHKQVPNQHKSNILCTQSQESQTPILSDIKDNNSSSKSSQANANEFIASQHSLVRQNSLQNKTATSNGLNEIQRQNSLQKHSHFPTTSCDFQQSKSYNNNLKSSTLSGFSQRGSEEKTTVGKDSIEKESWQSSSQRNGLSYLKNSQQNQYSNLHEKNSIQKFSTTNNNSSPVFSMNEILNRHRSESGSTKKDGFLASSVTSLGDKSNKSSLSKIQEDQYQEDENQCNRSSDYDYHPYNQRLKTSASVNKSNKEQTNKDSQPLIQSKNIFNQNQIRKQQQYEENESFGFNNNSYNQGSSRSNQLSQGVNTSNKNIFNQFAQGTSKDQNKFLSAQKEEFKKYESLYSNQFFNKSEGFNDDNSSNVSEKVTPGKFSLSKISPSQKFSSQPLSNNYFQNFNNRNNNSMNNNHLNNDIDIDDDDDSEEDVEYLKKLAKSAIQQPKPIANIQQPNNKYGGLTLFKSNSSPLPQLPSASNLSDILKQFKCSKDQSIINRQQSNTSNTTMQRNVSIKRTQSRIFENDSDEEESDLKQIIKKCNSTISTQKAAIEKKQMNPKQQQKKKIVNKKRRLIKEDDDYYGANKFFEEEAKSDGDHDDEEEEDNEEFNDFIDDSSPYKQYAKKNNKKSEMRDFDDYESYGQEENDNRYGNKRKIEKQSSYGSKLKKKLCLDDDDFDDDDEEEQDGYQSIAFKGKREKAIYQTETKKKTKEELKEKLNKENKQRVIDSDESISDQKRRSSKKKNRKFDFSESDGAVDENDDYEEDSFIDNDSFVDDIFEQEEQMNLGSPSNNDEDHDDIENKIFLNIPDQIANKKKKKLIKGANLGEIDLFQCTVCLDQPSDTFFGQIDCSHRFCYSCIENWSKVTNQCPMCRKEFYKIIKRNFDGSKNPSRITEVRRKKQRVNEEDYIEEAQAIQDEEDRAALGVDGAENNQPNIEEDPSICYKCAKSDRENLLLICDVCDENCCHTYCDENIRSNRVPDGRWACHFCRF